jgi:transposase
MMSERHSMRKIREVLRLRYELGQSQRSIAAAVAVAPSAVWTYLVRAEEAGISWEVAKTLTDAELESTLFKFIGRNEPRGRAPIDFSWVHTELRRKGVTLQLLWTEYQEATRNEPGKRLPYQYSQFCDLYAAYRKKLAPSMRQVHRAGEKAFVDFSGAKPRMTDPKTGETVAVELFVLVLGASNYTYAEVTRTTGLADFVGATIRGLEYFGAAPEILVPDQLKAAVKTPDWCEPQINATVAEMAQHYGLAVVPARPRKPKDKAKVENGVLIAQRWIVAHLRNHTFFSLEELNAAIRERCEVLNTRPFQKLQGCRRSLFESLDRPAMRELPPRRYEMGVWKLNVGVNVDYHIAYDDRHYSVPCELIQARVDVRATATTIEVFREGMRITSHERSYGPKGTAVTNPDHRPRHHRAFGDWPPERLISWAGKTGPNAAAVAEAILTRGPHPESGRRACLALVRMAEQYGNERVEAACARAIAIHNPTRKSVEAILKSGLDKLVMIRPAPREKLVVHENIRGGEYFARDEQPIIDEEEIEAKYLAEERLGIMMGAPDEPLHEPPAKTGATLVGLLERLSKVWTRPEPGHSDAPRNERGEAS